MLSGTTAITKKCVDSGPSPADRFCNVRAFRGMVLTGSIKLTVSLRHIKPGKSKIEDHRTTWVFSRLQRLEFASKCRHRIVVRRVIHEFPIHLASDCLSHHLADLEILSLTSTKVTAAGLNELAALKNLHQLNILGVKVSKMDLKNLIDALPALKIN
jgi:hypothetical protein